MTDITASHETILLRVGEKQFHTSKHTLSPSGYFNALFTIHPSPQTDFFLDADPDIFTDVLRYLRTHIYPLYHTPDNGFDVPRYHALLAQARLLQLDELAAWVSNKEYLNAVWTKTRFVSATLYGDRQLEQLQNNLWSNEERTRSFSFKQADSRAWKCPAGVYLHDGDKAACVKARCPGFGGEHVVSMRTFKIDAIVEKVEIREDVLVEMRPDVLPPYHGHD
ncbi:BTB/POZ domain-containing protein [Pochonia chlamydosporia 170]|uniref:BTB/POZ domain-containing protein n=1 Tax=Pochonia chlamydosporia 170 TaxID=1380566 RepID=A0A179G542_METCM|nr:BTB/POZ domain-containing protein [Pochonia chlamydosporia 170]OAQ72259.1 BTB/POZ domain-containing protein [Pochonia chlamydosporia 170]